jgi:hypothetical protein
MTGQLGIDGQTQPERVCACGCGRSLDGMRRGAKWESRACAVRWSRENPGSPLSDAYNPNRSRTRKRRTPSERGLQVSFRKAIEVLHAELRLPKLAIESALEPALSARQRQQLFEREAA